MSASPSPNTDERQDVDLTRIEVSTHGNRRAIEALYLELRQLAKQYGLKVEYRLTKSKPENSPDK